MNINGITSAMQPYTPNKAEAVNVKELAKVNAVGTVSSASAEGTAAVYEPGKVSSVDSANKSYKPNQRLVSALQTEVGRRTEEMESLVSKSLAKQGQTLFQTDDMYALLREGKVTVDPATAAKAREDIGEEGYWGVKQTSERLFSFAQALTGGDPAKAEAMRDAVIKGFESAKETWGGELPEICQKTYEATMAKFDDWTAENKTE